VAFDVSRVALDSWPHAATRHAARMWVTVENDGRLRMPNLEAIVMLCVTAM
jgi:hypothetical protein